MGFLAAADDTQIGRPVRQLVAIRVLAQQRGQLDHPGLSEVTWPAVTVEHVVPGILGHSADGGAFASSKIPADGVMHPPSRRGIQGRDVVDQAMRGTGTVHSDQ